MYGGGSRTPGEIRHRQRAVMEWKPNKKDAWPSRKERISRFAITQILSRLIEYTQYSSMHGLRYIGDLGLHPFERIFWVLAFIFAAGSSAYFISNLFIKFEVMPVIMSLSPQSSTIKDIPFPSITICNMNHLRKTEAQRILNISSDDADLDQKLIYDFCDANNIPQDFDRNVTANWEYIKKFMVKMTQPCHELLITCKWHGDIQTCSDFFNPSLTDEGMCCVFNRLNRELIFKNPRDLSDLNVTYPYDAVDWSPERGYATNTPLDNLPRRSRGSGTHLGLTVVVDAELSEYFCSSENGKGFKVLLNNPIETPKVSSFGVSIAPGQETKVVVVPRIMTATPQLQSVDLSKRLCFFEHERMLAFYRTYSQRSCVLECEANFTLAFCGCVLYYMPKNKYTRICGRTDRICAQEAQRTMELSMSMNEGSKVLTKGAKKELEYCNCLPGCFELSYSFMISSAPLTDQLILKPNLQVEKDYKYFRENMAIIHFFFMERQFSGTVRGVLFGFTEFLSNAGGLLGLFMGFSFMSAVELIYFLTLRIWFHLHKHKTEPIEKKIAAAPLNNTISTILKKSNFPFNQ